MARVPQIVDKSQIAPEFGELYDRIAASRGGVAGPFSILLHAPHVADKVEQLSRVLREGSSLSGQDFVLAALAVARAKDCMFVWSVQARNARRAGISEKALDAVRDRASADLTEDQQDIVAYTQAVVSSSRVDGHVFERLLDRHGVAWLVELTSTAGHFGLISGINNAFDVPPADTGDVLPI
ncbi:MAG: carboxymuconolactone decarboxylase family protein [Chloroflexota bacterium]